MIEDFLPDMEDTMQSYVESNEYRLRQRTIKEAILTFRSMLPEYQHSAFNRLIDMINDADSIYSKEAYRTGFALGRENKADSVS